MFVYMYILYFCTGDIDDEEDGQNMVGEVEEMSGKMKIIW